MDKNLEYFLIFNPAANQGRAAKKIPLVEEFFNDWALSYDLAVTKKPKEATRLAQEAAKNFDVVVAVGGDGTINEVANGMCNSKATLGIVPVGAGNDFSRALGLSRGFKRNLEILIKNRVRQVDIGLVNDRFFVNVLGVGFDALVAQEMFARPKFLKGFSVYLYGLLKTLKKYRFTALKIKADNFKEKKEYLMVAVANGTFFGGGFHITPRASIEDGYFDVALIDKMARNYLLKNIPKVIKGTHESLPEVKIIKSKRVVIESDQELPVEYDGEILKGQKRLEISLLPQSLAVIGR